MFHVAFQRVGARALPLLALLIVSLVCAPGCATSLQARIPDLVPYDEAAPGPMPSLFDGDVEDITAGLPVGVSTADLTATELTPEPDPTDWLGAGEQAPPADMPDPTTPFEGDMNPPQPAMPPTGEVLDEGARVRDIPSTNPVPSATQPMRPRGVSPRGSGRMPPVPPPPSWDSRRDKTVRLGPDGRTPLGQDPNALPPPAGDNDLPSTPTPADPMPADPFPRDPMPADPMPADPMPVDPGVGEPTPADDSGLGAPPGGAVGAPFPTDAPTPRTTTTNNKPAPRAPNPDSPFLSDNTGGTGSTTPEPRAPVRPTSSAGDALPPTGSLPPIEPGTPPTGTQPSIPEPTPAPTPEPAAGTGADPWLPGGHTPAPTPEPRDPVPAPVDPVPAPVDPAPVDPAPVDPAPVDPAPVDPAPPAGNDPWLPGGGDQPKPTTEPVNPPTNPPVNDDPWSSGADTPAPPAGNTPAGNAPAVNEDPWQPGPAGTTPAPGADTPADPWQPAGSSGLDRPTAPTPTAPTAADAGYVGKTPEARALEHTTRLMDDPGSPSVPGYPSAVIPSDPPGQALTPGLKPVVIVFHDDSSRVSDLQAARLLSLLVRYRAQIDFVAVNRGPGASRSGGGEELAGRYLDKIPTVVVLDSERKTRMYKSGPFDADELERALDLCLTGEAPPAQPETAPREVANDPFKTAAPDPAGNTPEARSGMSFTPPKNYSAKQHVQRLTSSPGDASVPGYPTELITSAPAETVLNTGLKPVVILFHDDASKASDLQAAAFLPTIVRRQKDVDFVIIDVSTRARWSDAQKKVVRTYYNFYVPTTVVLAPNRAPIKSWYSRTEADSLERAIDEAGRR